ncbi:MAG: hypothetical protein J6X92_02710 [Bacteroidales bacterium]|nr:hypothetical protein [Bacteroidales bacterium]
MAYATKYELLCAGKDGVVTKLVISEDGYTGQEIDRNVPNNPFELTRDRSGAICGTSLTFRIREEVDFEFLSLYTEDFKKYKAEMFRPSTAVSPMWSGYLNTAQYAAEYISAPINQSFIATDGLGLLKNFSFDLEGLYSELYIINYCLSKIGLGLGYSIAINIWESSQDDTRAVLAQTYLKGEAFSGKTCYEVVEGIVARYDATITQYNNRWHIVSYKDRQSTRLLYDNTLTYEGTQSAPSIPNLVANADTASTVYPSGHLSMNMKRGGKVLPIYSNYQYTKSVFKNANFKKYSNGAFENWTHVYGSYRNLKQLYGADTAAYLEGNYNSTTENAMYIAQISEEIKYDPDQQFSLSLKYAPVAYGKSGMAWRGVPDITLNVNVWFMLIYITSSHIYYLDVEEGWVEDEMRHIKQVAEASLSVQNISFNDFQIKFNIPAYDGQFEVALFWLDNSNQPIDFDGHLYQPRYLGVAWKDIDLEIYNVNEDVLEIPTELNTIVTFDDSANILTLDTADLQAVDAPNSPNAQLLYNGVSFLSDGSLTETWSGLGAGFNDVPLVEVYANMVASRNRSPLQVLRGTIKGSFDPDTMFRHVQNSNRRFFADEITWHIRDNAFTGEFVEYMEFVEQNLTWQGYTPHDVEIEKITPVITWEDQTLVYGGVWADIMTATANTQGGFIYYYLLDGNWAYMPISAQPAVGTYSMKVDFFPNDTIHYTDASSTATLTVTGTSVTITWNPGTSTIANGGTWTAQMLNASANQAGTMRYYIYGSSTEVEVGDTLDVSINVNSVRLQADFTPSDPLYSEAVYPANGQSFTVSQSKLSLGSGNNDDGNIIVSGTGQHLLSIALTTTVQYTITNESGTGFTLRINNSNINLPYTDSVSRNLQIYCNFGASVTERRQVFKITPQGGHKLQPIYLNCTYSKDPIYERD